MVQEQMVVSYTRCAMERRMQAGSSSAVGTLASMSRAGNIALVSSRVRIGAYVSRKGKNVAIGILKAWTFM